MEVVQSVSEIYTSKTTLYLKHLLSIQRQLSLLLFFPGILTLDLALHLHIPLFGQAINTIGRFRWCLRNLLYFMI